MYNLPPAGTPFTSKPVYHKKLYFLHAKLNFVDFPKTPSWISKFIFQKIHICHTLIVTPKISLTAIFLCLTLIFYQNCFCK